MTGRDDSTAPGRIEKKEAGNQKPEAIISGPFSSRTRQRRFTTEDTEVRRGIIDIL
jgi:hypothetical protein